jgi:predicted CXXCH cytochrome family protein
MPSIKHCFFLIVVLMGFLFLGDSQIPPIALLAPTLSDSSAYDQGLLLLVSASKEIGSDLVLSQQWEIERVIDVSTNEAKDSVAKTFFRLFEPGMTLGHMNYRYRVFKGYTRPDTLSYAYTDTMSVRAFWKTKDFADFVKKTKATEGAQLHLYMKGWRDSTYSAVYDDPAADGRSLFKLHVQLIPGLNNIYVAPAGRKTEGVALTAIFKAESKSAEDFSHRFHNSKLEENCHACHEGLPGASSGLTMTADCAVCHKAKFSATYLHGPVEMKECGTCHSWSAEKNSVIVEKGVPEVCYACHEEKKDQVENSASPHPVAGDCLGCHSPHGTEQPHLLKTDIFRLCTGCHQEYGINHPVGRHPVRFARLKDSSEEISCATCHNPHGSPNEAMLTMPGGRMESCSQCH